MKRIVMSSFQTALQIIRDKTSNTTELGKAFEGLAKVFLERHPIQKQQYGKVWHYAEWVREYPEYPSTDTGIDLVAEMKDESVRISGRKIVVVTRGMLP